MPIKRILLVEDEGITAMDLEASLNDLGYEVVGIATTGESAISLTTDREPDLILMDIKLKGEMDGIKAVEHIHAHFDVPVVYLTAHADQATLERAKKTSPFGYIVKPFNEVELNSTIQMALNKFAIEQEMKRNSDELQLIANAVKDAIIASDDSGNILFWNRGAGEMFGYEEKEVFEKPLTILMPEIFRAAHAAGINRVLQLGASKLADQVFELEALRKNGQTFPMEMSLSTWARGKKRFFAAVVRDISERRNMEEREQYAAFQSGVAEMSVAILHNIGNAIMGISHRAEKVAEASEELQQTGKILARMKGILDKKKAAGMSAPDILVELEKILTEVGARLQQLGTEVFAEHSKIITSGVRHIAEIIELHQDAARPEIQSVQFNLTELLNNAIAIQVDNLEKYGISTQVSVGPEVQIIFMPRSQLLQLMINLIKNSREAIQKRMKTDSQQGLIQIRAALVDGEIELRVKDNGCGIDRQDLDKVFKYGFSTRKKSTGFGLHSVANFVQSQRGMIHAESAGVNQGAEFIIRFPANLLQKAPNIQGV